MINSITDAIGWVQVVLASNPRLHAYALEIISPRYGPFTEARVLQTFFQFGGTSWPTDDPSLLIWGREIMQQLHTTGLMHLSIAFCDEKGEISTQALRAIMKSVRAMLLYLEDAPSLSFNPGMRFYMVTAKNKPLPATWLQTPPGGIVTVERILSVDTPDPDGFLRPWGSANPIMMPLYVNNYHLAVIEPARNDRTRLRPSPVIDIPLYSSSHKFKAPPGTQFIVVRVEPNLWAAEPRFGHPEDIHTHIILREREDQPPYEVPECIRRAGKS